MSAAVLCGPVFVDPHVREKQLSSRSCTTINDNDLWPFLSLAQHLLRLISLAVIGAAFPVAVWAKGARKYHGEITVSGWVTVPRCPGVWVPWWVVRGARRGYIVELNVPGLSP